MVAIAFNISLFWFIWRRGRPRLAVVSLGVAIGCAGGMGLARLMDGAHFLSDILCAMFLSFLVSLVLYYFVLRIPKIEDG